MKDSGSGEADTANSGGDQNGLPSSGVQNNRDGTERAQNGASVPNGSACSGIPGGCEGTGEEGALVEKPPHDPEQEGEDEESQFLEFDLTVPFLSFTDAEIARMYLTQEDESLEGAVHTELRVTGSDLVIRVTSENSNLLYSSVSSCSASFPQW